MLKIGLISFAYKYNKKFRVFSKMLLWRHFRWLKILIFFINLCVIKVRLYQISKQN